MIRYIVMLLLLVTAYSYAGWDAYRELSKARSAEARAREAEELYNKARSTAFDLDRQLRFERDKNTQLDRQLRFERDKNAELEKRIKALRQTIEGLKSKLDSRSGSTKPEPRLVSPEDQE